MANKKYCKVPVINKETAKLLSEIPLKDIVTIKIPNSNLFFVLRYAGKEHFWYLNTPEIQLKSLNKFKNKDIQIIKSFVLNNLREHEEFLKLKHC